MTRRIVALPLALVFLMLSGCTQEKKPASPPPAPKVYTVRGEVTALDTATHTATLRHERIEGWMEAMTMEFPVKDPAEFAKLTVGDRVDATLHVNDLEYYLAKIQVTAKAPAK